MRLKEEIEQYRVMKGKWATVKGDLHGLFWIPLYGSQEMTVLSSGHLDENWEHVSVSMPKRTPSWKEMCMVKDYFWDEADCVVQYHPPKSQYVNFHPNCLHLWKFRKEVFPIPHYTLVGPMPEVQDDE